MKELKNEFYCRDCEERADSEYRIYECPKCGGNDIYNAFFVTCDCGEKVFVDRFTNECWNCGRLYNSSGQELAPPDQWDEEDRYACFGPQNFSDDF